MTDVSQDEGNEFYKIHVGEKLVENGEYSIYLEFQGPLKDDLKGIYWSSYQDGDVTRLLTLFHNLYNTLFLYNKGINTLKPVYIL